MANSLKIPLVLGSDADFSKKSNDSKLLNMFIHEQPPGSKSQYIILNSSGLQYGVELPEKIYGTYVYKNILYVVTASALYSVDVKTHTYTKLADVDILSYCTFADNGLEIAFASSGKAYSYNPDTATLSTIDITADSVAFIDGYFVFNKSNTRQFALSDLYSTTIDPTMFASAESDSDNLIAAKTTPTNIWLFGERSIEVWYDAGASDFPFARINEASLHIGIIRGTDALLRENIFFVGSDYKVYQTIGYSTQLISTHAIEKALSDNATATMRAFTFIEYGHYFYALTIGDVVTYVYDVVTRQWHTRQSYDFDTWRIQGALRHGDLLVGFDDTKLYEMSINFYDENGTNIKREIQSLPINTGVDRMRILELQLDMEVGLDTEAAIYLRMSKDGGVTWSNRYAASTGAIGENRTRVRWTRLGQFRDAMAKIYTYDKIPIRIIGLSGRIML